MEIKHCFRSGLFDQRFPYLLMEKNIKIFHPHPREDNKTITHQQLRQ